MIRFKNQAWSQKLDVMMVITKQRQTQVPSETQTGSKSAEMFNKNTTVMKTVVGPAICSTRVAVWGLMFDRIDV